MSATSDYRQFHSFCLDRIRILSGALWPNRLKLHSVERWLENFAPALDEDSIENSASNCESLHALFLLSHFMYFGETEIRELLKVLYRDFIKRPRLSEIKTKNSSASISEIDDSYHQELKNTRFLGVGNPADSGSFLLYFFRQENQLSRKIFIASHEVYSVEGSGGLRDESITSYHFIDDFCGSGDTGMKYSKDFIKDLKAKFPHIRFEYHSLFSMGDGLRKLREESAFDVVNSVIELDDSFKVFSEKSRYFTKKHPLIDRDFCRAMAEKYGSSINAEDPLGYKNGQLLISFNHNTPNNTLPIFWANQPNGWRAIFPRYRKQYGWGESTIS